jgi:hypothetical protein
MPADAVGNRIRAQRSKSGAVSFGFLAGSFGGKGIQAAVNQTIWQP